MDRGAWRVTVHGIAKESDTTKQQQQYGAPGILCSARSYCPLPGWGLQFLQKNSEMCCYIYPKEEPVPCCTTVSCLFLLCFCIPSLSRVVTLNLPFETQGRSRRLKPSSYKQETGDAQKDFCSQAWFHQERSLEPEAKSFKYFKGQRKAKFI